MPISALFNIGLSGLETMDELLQVTGNNVANSQTPDYTREQANLSTVPTGSVSTTGAAGNGVQVADVTRAYSSFVNAQVNAENSNVSYWNNYNTAITQVQDIFNEASSAGISPAITTFFTDWQNVAQNPQDDAQRTTLISDANSLSTSLNSAATSLNSVSGQLLTSSQTLVSQVNTYTAQIATLNGELAGNPGSLDLQDQRDALLSQLNGIVKVSSYQDPASGTYSVIVGGAPLVEGTTSYNMSVAIDSSNNMQFYVGVEPNAGTASNPEGSPGDPEVTSFITGGQLASNIDLRNTQIPKYMNQLNAFAVDLADITNYYQTQGYGLNGSTGTNFFQPLSQLTKYTSASFTSPSSQFSANGGTLTIKLGDNDTSPATVNVAAGSTLQQTIADINAQAGSKVTASVVNLGTSASPAYGISIQSNPAGNLSDLRISASTTDSNGTGLNLLSTSSPLSNGTPGAAGAVISSVNVTDPTQTLPNSTLPATAAQYKIDYNGNIAATFDINSSNNTIVFNDGSGNKTATISTAGSPYTGAGLAAAINSALKAAEPGTTLSVDYNVTSPNNFTIQNSGSTAATIDWSDPLTNATPQQFGFASAATNTIPAGGYLPGTGLNAAFVINSTDNTIAFTYNGHPYTATLNAGAYTGSGMATEIATEMNGLTSTDGSGATIPANTFSADYGVTSPDEFTITNNGADNASITWANNNATQQLGFSAGTSNINAGSSLTAATAVAASYQPDGSTGTYWRVMESTNGSTWTAIDPNTLYNPSVPSSLNEAEVNLTSDSAGLSRTLEFQGIQVQIDGSGINSTTNPNGETFDVQFDPNAAKDITTAITDPNQVAASTDTWNIDSSNNSVVFSVNGGPDITAVIPSGTYTNDPGQSDDISAALTSAIQTAYQTATGSALPDTLNAAFNPNTKQFNVTMTSGSDSISLLWSSSGSTANQIFGFSGDSDTPVSFVAGTSAVSDNPASVEANATQGLPGNNTNANTIANLANGTMFGGTTPTDMYMSLVSNIGVDASSAITNQQYHTTLASELTQQQQQVSGVSMDEQAANLVVYQQSYQAAAELITTANQMLTTLLQMVNPSAT